jgi:hypothetical protein
VPGEVLHQVKGKRDISLRLAEKAGGQELMDCHILWDANSYEIGRERDRTKCIPRRILNSQVHVLRKEEMFNLLNLSILTI